MFNFEYITKKDTKEHDPNQPEILNKNINSSKLQIQKNKCIT